MRRGLARERPCEATTQHAGPFPMVYGPAEFPSSPLWQECGSQQSCGPRAISAGVPGVSIAERTPPCFSRIRECKREREEPQQQRQPRERRGAASQHQAVPCRFVGQTVGVTGADCTSWMASDTTPATLPPRVYQEKKARGAGERSETRAATI